MTDRPIFEDESALALTVEQCKRKEDSGASTDEVIVFVHDQGFSILDCMKIVKRVYGVDLGEAKLMITRNPAWSAESDRMRSLGEAFADFLEHEDR